MRKIILVFCVSLFLVMAFSQSSTACPTSIDAEDLVFEGTFEFDLDGMYYYGMWYPLNVLGQLTVFDGEEELGDLSLNGQKNNPGGEWDETYFGHWVFDPVGCGCDYEIGIFPDLSQYDNMLGFTLSGFNDVLGITGEIPMIEGSLDGNHFNGSPVPIPASVLLFGSGLIGLVGLKRRRR